MFQSPDIERQPSLHEVIDQKYKGNRAEFLRSYDLDVNRHLFNGMLSRKYTEEVLGAEKWQALSEKTGAPKEALTKHLLPPMEFNSISETPAYQLLDRKLHFKFWELKGENTFFTYCKEKLEGRIGPVALVLRGVLNIESRTGIRLAHMLHERLAEGTSISFYEFFPDCYWNRESKAVPLPGLQLITNVDESTLDSEMFSSPPIDRDKFIAELLTSPFRPLTKKQNQVLQLRFQGYTLEQIANKREVRKQAIACAEKAALDKFPPDIRECIKGVIAQNRRQEGPTSSDYQHEPEQNKVRED